MLILNRITCMQTDKNCSLKQTYCVKWKHGLFPFWSMKHPASILRLPERKNIKNLKSNNSTYPFSYNYRPSVNNKNEMISGMWYTVTLGFWCTVCPRSSDPFYIVRYYINRVTTSWTESSSCSLFTIFG